MATNHEQLVQQAVELQRELNKLNTGPAKLSPKAFLAEAMRNADITKPRLVEFQKNLQAASNVDDLKSFVRVAASAFAGVNYRRPPTTRLGVFGDVNSVQTQAGTVGQTLLHCVALAALQATESRPECFGSVDDIAGHESKIAALQQKLESLHAKIIATATIDDLELIEASGDKFEIFFKLARVSLAPKHDAGRRLIEALAA